MSLSQRPQTRRTGQESAQGRLTTLRAAERPSGALQALITADPALRGCGSALEALLVNRMRDAGLPLGEAQYRFVAGRQFRWDRCFPDRMVAIEVQGGTWTTTGAHSRGSGIERDCMKLSLGAVLGWRVLPITKGMIESGAAIKLIAQALGVE